MSKEKNSIVSQYALVALAVFTIASSGCQPTAVSIATPHPSTAAEIGIMGRICQYEKNFLTLGDRLFLRTAEFNRLELPVGTRVTLDVTINGTPHQVSGLILDHDEDMLECTFRLNEATRMALGVDDDVESSEVRERPIRDFWITVESVPAPLSASTPFKGRVCQYREDFLALGDRLFLRTAEFNRLGLPIGTKVTLAVTVNGTPRQVSGLILDHDEGMVDCTVRLDEATRTALGMDDDVGIPEVEDRPIRDFQVTTEP
jgi:hypothetical protein